MKEKKKKLKRKEKMKNEKGEKINIKKSCKIFFTL